MRVIVTKSVQISVALDSPSLLIEMFLSSWNREGTLYMGVSTSAFRKKSRGQYALLTPPVFQVFLLKIIKMLKWYIFG